MDRKKAGLEGISLSAPLPDVIHQYGNHKDKVKAEREENESF
jgi:hypothetical protein